jgi:hypothetical protein
LWTIFMTLNRSRRGGPLNPAAAAALARDALIWLAGREDDIAAFLAAGGLSAGELRARAADPDLLGAVLDFVLADEARVTAFAAAAAQPPDALARARAALPGGDAPHWT